MQKELKDAFAETNIKIEEQGKQLDAKLKEVTKVADGLSKAVKSMPAVEIDPTEAALAFEPVLERIGRSLSSEVASVYRTETAHLRSALIPPITDLELRLRAVGENKKIVTAEDGTKKLEEKNWKDLTKDFALSAAPMVAGTVVGVAVYDMGRTMWDKRYGKPEEIEAEIIG